MDYFKPNLCKFKDSSFSCSQSIFSAVVVYMKHLGVKSRAVDKKSRGGFFRRQLVKVTLKKNFEKKSLHPPCFITSATTSIVFTSNLESSLCVFQNKKDESTKAKPRGVFPGIPSWIAGNSLYSFLYIPHTCYIVATFTVTKCHV